MATKDVLTSKGKDAHQVDMVQDIPLDLIDLPELFEMRDQKATDVTDLMNNIKSTGQLENPIKVRPNAKKQGRYELVQGHRRFKAVKQLGWKTILGRIKNMTDEEAFIAALSENTGRQDPTPVEEARAFKRARDDYKMSLDTIATKVGKDKSTVSNRIRLLDTSPKVIEALQGGKITAGHCEHGFMRLKNKGDQDKLLKDVVDDIKRDNVVTVKDIEGRADNLNKEYEAGVKLQQFYQENKDKILTKNCPVCGKKPNPLRSSLSAKEPRLKCQEWHSEIETWDPFKKYDKKDFERSFGGRSSSGRTSKHKHENTRPNQVKSMASRYTIIEWYVFLFNKVLKSKPKIDDITLGSNCYFARGDCALKVSGKVAKQLMDLIGFELTFSELRNEDSEYKHVPKEYVTAIHMAANSRADIHTARKSVLTLEAEMGVFMKDKRDEAIVLRNTMYKNEMWREDIHFSKGAVVPGKDLGLKNESVEIVNIFEDLTMTVKDLKKGGQEIFVQDDDVKLMATRIARFHEKNKGKSIESTLGGGKKASAQKKGGFTPRTQITQIEKAGPAKFDKDKPGTCSVCGCTENDPCIDDFEETCAWANKEKTLCTFCAEKKKGKVYTSTLHTNRKSHTKAKGKK